MVYILCEWTHIHLLLSGNNDEFGRSVITMSVHHYFESPNQKATPAGIRLERQQGTAPLAPGLQVVT